MELLTKKNGNSARNKSLTKIMFFAELRGLVVKPLTALLILLFAAQADADTLFLKNGNSLEGIIQEQDESQVIVEVKIGRINLPLADIERIETADADKNDLIRTAWQKESEQAQKIIILPKRETLEENPPAEPVFPQDKPEPLPAQKDNRVKKNISGSYYILQIPPKYESGKKWPLVIGLHWYTGDPEAFLSYWSIEAGRKNLFVACPKSADKGWEKKDVPMVMKMIEEIKAQYDIDPRKIFLVGHSSGANLAVYLGLLYPEKFRAVACVAGSLVKARKHIGDVPLSREMNKHIPVLIFIGDKDEKERIDFARTSKRLLEEYGYYVYYKEIPGVPHVYMSWYTKEISDWFLGLKR